MTAALVLLHVLGWGIFIVAVLPHHFQYKGLGLGLGVALTAYGLGARHAFDADHIAAIDNVTRKLMTEGKRPLATGFFFALGHSSVVVAAGVAMSIAARAVFHGVVDPHSTYVSIGGIVGTAISGGFLYMIAAMNVVVFVGIAKIFRELRHGTLDEEALERRLQRRGLMYRFFGRIMRSITHSWQMYPVGVLFALGFDTATEVLLLAATAAAATEGLPWYAVLALPVLFSAGVTLFDTLDGCFMNFAYGWAFSKPIRKICYNLVITGLSVAIAFLIGTVELLGLLGRELDLHGGLWVAVGGFSINGAGFVIVAVFVVVFLAAGAIWRFAGFEERFGKVAGPK